MADQDSELMKKIHDRWGDVLAGAASNTSLPESFLAALTANESGGNPEASRFESQVFLHLVDVITGARSSYGSIGRNDLLAVLNVSPDQTAVPKSLLTLRGLATSWGLTQIMGYHAFDLGVKIQVFIDPAGNLQSASRLLASFAHSFGIDLTKDFEELFRCWNTGQPNGKTFDPNYVANGLKRMDLYAQLVAQPADPDSAS